MSSSCDKSGMMNSIELIRRNYTARTAVEQSRRSPCSEKIPNEQVNKFPPIIYSCLFPLCILRQYMTSTNDYSYLKSRPQNLFDMYMVVWSSKMYASLWLAHLPCLETSNPKNVVLSQFWITIFNFSGGRESSSFFMLRAISLLFQAWNFTVCFYALCLKANKEKQNVQLGFDKDNRKTAVED